MSRSIFPKVFTDYFGIKSWNLSEEDKKGVISVVSRDEESLSLDSGNKIASSLLSVVNTAILGALFYFYQQYNESHNTAESLKDSLNPSSNSGIASIKISSIEDEINAHEYIRDGLIVCGIALLATTAVTVAMKNYIFAANDVANKVKNKISKMSPGDLANALEQIENDDLANFNVPKSSLIFDVQKMGISYVIAGLIANFSGFPEDKKYLLLAASKVVVSELLDIADYALCSKGNIKLFEEDFLNEFSDEEKDRLKKAIKSEIESNINKNNCSEGLIKLSTNLATTFAFAGSLHEAPTSSLISEEVFASAANFGVASLVFNVLRFATESLNDYSKIKKHPQVEEIDMEMGLNTSIISVPETRANSEMARDIPNQTILKRSKSENDIGSLKAKDDNSQPLTKSKSANNLVN
jgi:hypothetical protein